MALIYRTQQLTEVYANSGYWADIQDAVDQAALAGGGNVYILEGTWDFVNVDESWTDARVVIPVGVNLFGAPTERTSGLPYNGVGQNPNDQVVGWKTVLRLPWDVPGAMGSAPTWFRIVGNSDPSKPSRFSDIKLVGYRSIDSNSTAQHYAIIVSNVIDLRIDHCYFEHTVQGVGVSNSRGVVDHSYFVNHYGVSEPWEERTVTYGVGIYRGSGDLWEDDVSKVLGQYTNYTVFIEDCYFEKWRHCTAANQGAHYVLRYSTIANDFGFGSIDSHGWGEYPNAVGTRATEIYGCIVMNAIRSPWATMIRGGAGVAFNNRVGGGTYTAFIYFTIDGTWEKCWVKEWWIWSNTMLSGCNEIIEYDPGNNITESVNYFRYAPHTFNYEPYPYPHPLTLEEPPAVPTTPFLQELEEGVYEIAVPSIVTDGSDTYNFKQWNDGDTNPTKTINLTSDTSLTATYEKAIGLTTLRGIVKDNKGNPIADADVKCNGLSTKTFADGSYEFKDLENRQYTITLSKAGYQSITMQVDASNGGTINLPETVLSPTPITSAILPAGILLIGIAGITYLATRKKR